MSEAPFRREVGGASVSRAPRRNVSVAACAPSARTIGVLAVLAALSCAGPDDTSRRECVTMERGALTNADDDPGLPLSAAAVAAIGLLEMPESEELVCTGTLIGDRWILTAAHCVDPGAFNGLVFRTSLGSREVRTLVAEYYEHPALDVMLLRVPPSDALDDLVPISLWDRGEPADWVGRTVTLAGFGTREDGLSGRRQFLHEIVVESGAAGIVVDGGPDHGACSGDSGGPLLAESASGEVRVIGVLTAGSATCRGRDRYVPADTFVAWISGVRDAALSDSCAGLSAEGSCADGIARWCAGDYVEAERCDRGRWCDWDAAARGYRCVPEVQAPCSGVSPGGICRGNKVRVCERGTIVETDCSSCGRACKEEAGRADCR